LPARSVVVFALFVILGPAQADGPWGTRREQKVPLTAFAPLRPFAATDDQVRKRTVSVEEIEKYHDGYQLQFQLLDGTGAKAPILAYVQATVRDKGGQLTVNLDMMQSFGDAGAGTMTDLCQAIAQHPDFRRAGELTALLDFTNDRQMRTAVAGLAPVDRVTAKGLEAAFRSKETSGSRKGNTVVPLQKHLEALAGSELQVLAIGEVETGREKRFRIAVRPTNRRILPEQDRSHRRNECDVLLDLIP